jgi:molecular chaperone GrpE
MLAASHAANAIDLEHQMNPDRPEKAADDTEVEISEAEVKSTDEANDPNAKLAEIQAKADENWQSYLRAAAETENVRKRAARDVENAHKFALERIGRELLGVKDTLEMGVAVDDASVESLIEGSNATLKLLSSVLERFGIVEVDPEGEPFDPEFHEAISMQASDDAEPNSVLTVVQKGYTLNGRLLRPAMVIVASE